MPRTVSESAGEGHVRPSAAVPVWGSADERGEAVFSVLFSTEMRVDRAGGVAASGRVAWESAPVALKVAAHSLDARRAAVDSAAAYPCSNDASENVAVVV